MVVKIASLDHMEKLASIFASHVGKNWYIFLYGELAAGKTTFTRFLLNHLNVKENVASPTFNILNQYYVGELKINHMDAYRLSKCEDWQLYLEEFEDALNIIEWPEIVIDKITDGKKIKIYIELIDDNLRKISIILDSKSEVLQDEILHAFGK